MVSVLSLLRRSMESILATASDSVHILSIPRHSCAKHYLSVRQSCWRVHRELSSISTPAPPHTLPPPRQLRPAPQVERVFHCARLTESSGYTKHILAVWA